MVKDQGLCPYCRQRLKSYHGMRQCVNGCGNLELYGSEFIYDKLHLRIDNVVLDDEQNSQDDYSQPTLRSMPSQTNRRTRQLQQNAQLRKQMEKLKERRIKFSQRKAKKKLNKKIFKILSRLGIPTSRHRKQKSLAQMTVCQLIKSDIEQRVSNLSAQDLYTRDTGNVLAKQRKIYVIHSMINMLEEIKMTGQANITLVNRNRELLEQLQIVDNRQRQVMTLIHNVCSENKVNQQCRQAMKTLSQTLYNNTPSLKYHIAASAELIGAISFALIARHSSALKDQKFILKNICRVRNTGPKFFNVKADIAEFMLQRYIGKNYYKMLPRWMNQIPTVYHYLQRL